VDHAGSIAGLAAGDSVSLPVSPGGGWVARSVAHREPGSRMIRLVVQVALPDAQGRPMAAAAATLLLQSVAADTAIVTAERPRF
ncbi:MAG TPA: hypothetical protein PLL69_08175, partial [Gemmatimonadales bacterium]|nr:hypothetical protein [Gemmatimonadales bacterium]